MAKRRSKHAKSKTQTVERTKKSSRNTKSIWGYGALPSLCMLVFPAGAMLLTYILIVTPLETFNTTQKKAFQLESVAGQVKQSINKLKTRADELAKSDSIIEALKTGKGAREIESSVADFDYRIAAARLVKRGELRFDEEAVPPVTFQSIDLVRRALLGEKIEPELEGKYIRYAVAVREGEGDVAIGAVMIEYHKSAMAIDLGHSFTDGVFFDLHQSFGDGNKVPVWSYGDGTVALDASSVRSETAINKIWTLAFFKQAVSTQSDYILKLGVIGLAISLSCILFMIISVVLLQRTLKDDLTSLNNAAQALMRNRKPSDEKFKSTLVQQAYEVLYDILNTSTGVAKRNSSLGGASPDGLGADQSGQSMSAFANPLFESNSMVDSDEEEESLLEVEETEKAVKPVEKKKDKTVTEKPKIRVPKEIFRAYDIRGVVGKSLSVEVVVALGKAIGSQALQEKQSTVVVARDGRLSGPSLVGALKEGLLSTGINVIDVGMVPTPVLYFAAQHFKANSGVMLTGSHNPPSYNGLKIVINGTTLSGEQIQGLRQRVESADFKSGRGKEKSENGLDPYMDHILSDIVLARSLKLVIDCGNGVTGRLVPSFFEQLGCEVEALYADIDGQFPNHHPDPSNPENLKALINQVKASGADLGVAFDGDGDRIGLVTNKGKIIYPDRLMMLFSKDLLGRNPGADIIYDVKCTSELTQLISSLGGRPIMCKTGHSLIKAKLKETQAVIAGEMSGHIFFNDRWFGFDDAVYTAARLLEILSMEATTLDETFAEFPEKLSTPEINIQVDDESKFKIMDVLVESGDFGSGRKTLIDGVRVDYDNGWGLIRASNTTPVLVARFEADTDEAMNIIKTIFRDNLLKVKSDLDLPF